ncbi:radical SAM protein [Aliarcobacter cryaerophilus]|uniref:radical SAM/SPASM domain-containing protein n=1 Tax=Aliarcobacter cryaerophilus TaxID=28198 RepID=UPI0021B5F4AE|nr:radical SAM protein [Aliarcobacter cryaerophilus]MCT7539712.1 radical SAM protein [Aliarcobacter cryaerophilus]
MESNIKSNGWLIKDERNYLKDVLPLDMPLSLLVEVTRLCNFKCVYCAHAEYSERDNRMLSIELYKKALEGLKKFDRKLRSITFVGMGESLLHKDLPEMIKLSKQVSDKVTLVTNGSLLNKKNIDKLIDSGIDIIRISLQGLNKEEYKEISQVNINFEKFVENLTYLYKNKKQCQIYYKIPNFSLRPEYKDIFGPISDSMVNIPIAPTYQNVNYDKIENIVDNEKGLRSRYTVCPQPFYMLGIRVSGEVSPCCETDEACISVGNINTESLYDIWHGKKLKNMRLAFLKGNRNQIKHCANCVLPEFNNKSEYDDIDNYRDELIKKY